MDENKLMKYVKRMRAGQKRPVPYKSGTGRGAQKKKVLRRKFRATQSGDVALYAVFDMVDEIT